jgi:hypothetical protein
MHPDDRESHVSDSLLCLAAYSTPTLPESLGKTQHQASGAGGEEMLGKYLLSSVVFHLSSIHWGLEKFSPPRELGGRSMVVHLLIH